MKITSCCGYEATDPLLLDYGFCPECQEHCDFVDYYEEDLFNESNDNDKIADK